MTSEGISDNNVNSDNDHEPQLQLHQSRKALLSFAGDHNQGKAALDIIVRISMATVVSYPGEKDLQVQSVVRLSLGSHHLFSNVTKHHIDRVMSMDTLVPNMAGNGFPLER
ncbi:unnamed protein product [Ilex paraguariensis]